MSNRTSEADKAIRLAWKREQELVRQGKGTRDWTPEQQADILERGKAYDCDGKAFRGHHMKNVEDFPDFQGNPDNIQFLSVSEHLEAHKGNFQNSTNGYFNPITKEFVDFGDGLIPCKIIELSNPIVKIQVDENKELKHEESDKTKEDNKAPPKQEQNSSSKIINPKKENFIIKGFKKIGNGYLNFRTEHPFWSNVLETVATNLVIDGITLGTSKATSKLFGNSSSNKQVGSKVEQSVKNNDLSTPQSKATTNVDSPTTNNDIPTNTVPRKSPDEHMVNTKGQHYNTKKGREWRDVNPYPRGGKKD